MIPRDITFLNKKFTISKFSHIIDHMVEQIEIKRKFFDVVETIGKRTKKVERKGTFYFLKDFGKETKQFNDYVEGFNKLKVTGIRVPKIYVYDKAKNIVVTEFIEGKTVLDQLLEADLDEKVFELAFNTNWFCKKDKISIDFDPKNFKVLEDKLVYLSMNSTKYDERWNFEKNHIVIWFYSREFVKYCKNNLIEFDQSRVFTNEGELNKKIALTVVKYYK